MGIRPSVCRGEGDQSGIFIQPLRTAEKCNSSVKAGFKKFQIRLP
jgi:hypothetical protein